MSSKPHLKQAKHKLHGVLIVTIVVLVGLLFVPRTTVVQAMGYSLVGVLFGVSVLIHWASVLLKP